MSLDGRLKAKYDSEQAVGELSELISYETWLGYPSIDQIVADMKARLEAQGWFGQFTFNYNGETEIVYLN